MILVFVTFCSRSGSIPKQYSSNFLGYVLFTIYHYRQTSPLCVDGDTSFIAQVPSTLSTTYHLYFFSTYHCLVQSRGRPNCFKCSRRTTVLLGVDRWALLRQGDVGNTRNTISFSSSTTSILTSKHCVTRQQF